MGRAPDVPGRDEHQHAPVRRRLRAARALPARRRRGIVPADVVSGFHACIGYKVLKAAVEVATGYPLKVGHAYPLELQQSTSKNFGSWHSSWRLLLPALVLGVPLYLCWRFHWGRPMYMFPASSSGRSRYSAPPSLRAAPRSRRRGASSSSIRRWRSRRSGVSAAASNCDSVRTLVGAHARGARTVNSCTARSGAHARACPRPPSEHVAELYGVLGGSVAWDVLPQCGLTWLSMLLIVTLDSLLITTTTETVVAIDIDYDYEMRIGALTAVLNSLVGGQPVYSQTKFTQINYAITHSLRSAARVRCGALCGALYLSPLQLFNYLPRFVLSGLLVFAACGFFVENLYDARKKFNRLSFAATWLIFLVNVWQGLLVAIGMGLGWATLSFAIIYARKGKLLPPISGSDHCSPRCARPRRR